MASQRAVALAHAAIIGGTFAREDTFPQLAYILDEREAGTVLACTGTVVAANVILTAGHCAENTTTGVVNNPAGYEVVTGSVDWELPQRQISRVSRVIVYPGFNRGNLTGDAALLVLATPTTAPAITLASYPSDAARLEGGTVGLIAGWGEREAGEEELAPLLSWAATVVQSSSYCRNNSALFNSGYEICTIYPPGYETGTCHGDSGGPLLTQNATRTGDIELGITSHGDAECSTERPSVFTRVDLVSRWVNEWIAAVKPAGAPSLGAPAAPVQATPVYVAPPNTPGYYVTRASRTRKLVIHVSGDGAHVVGLSIKLPVNCRHGLFLPSLQASYLSYSKSLTISEHTAHGTLPIAADRESRTGALGVFLRFTTPGSLEGRLRIHIPFRSRRVGLCSGTLSFTAKI